MTSNSTVATSAAAGGFVGSLVILICLGLSHYHVDVPPVGTAAMIVVLQPFVHWAAIRLGLIPSQESKP